MTATTANLSRTSAEQPAGPEQHLHRPGRRGCARGGALPRHRPRRCQLRDRPAAGVQRPQRATKPATAPSTTTPSPACEHGIYNGIKAGHRLHEHALRAGDRLEPSGGESVNDCGENAVNSGPAGKLDGFSIVLGHEIEETITDPGAEDILGSGTSHHEPRRLVRHASTPTRTATSAHGSASRSSADCPARRTCLPIPGAMGDIKGNRGHDVRRAVAVEQRSRRRHRLLRGRGNGPAVAQQ